MWGGGNYLTESYPTNFHHFYKRKMLTQGEKPEDFKEVTQSQRDALENAEAEWQRPPQAFIDLCTFWGVNFNEESGYFELNGLKDLTYHQMIPIIQLAPLSRLDVPDGGHARRFQYLTSNGMPCRTYIPISYYTVNAPRGDASYMFAGWVNNALECVVFGNSPDMNGGAGSWTKSPFTKVAGMFQRNMKLHTVKYLALHLVTSSANTADIFRSCSGLTTCELICLRCDISFQDCPILSLESIEFICLHREGENQITITLHPDVFARIPDELFELAVSKNITIATV